MYKLLAKSLIMLLVAIIYSCSNSNNRDVFLYENENQKIEIKILNGNDYLEYDKPIRTDIVLTNINPRYLSVHGVGIHVVGVNDSIYKLKIKVPSGYLKTDTLHLKVRFRKDRKMHHEFKIPIK